MLTSQCDDNREGVLGLWSHTLILHVHFVNSWTICVSGAIFYHLFYFNKLHLFCQVFHVTFTSNFFAMFRDHLIKSDVFPSVRCCCCCFSCIQVQSDPGNSNKQRTIKNASKLSAKKDLDISNIVHWMRAKLSLQFLRSAIPCVRGSRSVRPKVAVDINEIEIVSAVDNIRH